MSKSWLVCIAGTRDEALTAPGTHVGLPGGRKFEIIDIPFITGNEYDQSKFVYWDTALRLLDKYPEQWQIVTDAEIAALERMMEAK
jgi:hypothetical protein